MGERGTEGKRRVDLVLVSGERARVVGVAFSRVWLAMEIRSGIARPPPARGLFFFSSSSVWACFSAVVPFLFLLHVVRLTK